MAIRTYKDIDLSFIPNPVTGDITKKIGDAAVVQSVMNLLQLNHFEFPFHPDIGSNITKLLFEQLSSFTAQNLEKEITNTLKNFEDRITIYKVQVQVDENNNGFNVTIVGFINNNPNPIQISAFLERDN